MAEMRAKIEEKVLPRAEAAGAAVAAAVAVEGVLVPRVVVGRRTEGVALLRWRQ